MQFSSRANRRAFFQSAGAIGFTAAIQGGAEADAKAPSAEAVVQGKDSRLVVHKAEIPVLESEPAAIRPQITPLKSLFVRNNQPLKGITTLQGRPLKGWSISLSGLIEKAGRIRGSLLEDLEQVEHEMVLQCCGNGRSLFAQSVKAKGTQWTRGGMGNVRVAGVRLSALLDKLNVRIQSQARYLTAEGADVPLPGKQDFEHSLPLEDALQHSLLVLRMNGQPLPAIHGGPVRLMTPGFYGTMHIKWLTALRFESDESDNYNHIPRYRTPREPIRPGAAIRYTFANSKACWRMKVKSVVLHPQPKAVLKRGEPLELEGVAFNDGASPIESVLLSTNRGRSWRRCRLQQASGPYAWRRFSLMLKLPPGEHEIWTRATDGLGRSQPLDGSVHWNPSGYEWNGVEKIPVRVV